MGEGTYGGNLIELTAKNYDGTTKIGKPVMIQFYSDNCPACNQITPDYVDLAGQIDGRVVFARSHLLKGGVAEKLGVENAPTFALVYGGKVVEIFPGLIGSLGSRDYRALPRERLEKRIKDALKNVPSTLSEPKESDTETGFYQEAFEDGLVLTHVQKTVLESRYLAKDEHGIFLETPNGLFRRVAKTVASAEEKYRKNPEQTKETEEEFYRMMVNLEFMPNSPTLMNAGKGEQQLSACFVLPIHDNMRSIAYTVGNTAIVHKSGGGTGFDFSELRPQDDFVTTTYGRASGPVSFIDTIDRMTEAVNQGGFRRGANMGILRVDHPDIEKFINAKTDPRVHLKNRKVYASIERKLGEECLPKSQLERILAGIKKSLCEQQLNNFNLSVAITDEFMEAVRSNREYDLINPRNGEVAKRDRARRIFDMIVQKAWENGDPGLVFIDTINRKNQTPHLGKINSTNPCGEQPLLPYEACNLGSINLARMIDNGQINYEKLEKTVRASVRFLDDVIDVNKLPRVVDEELFEGKLDLDKITGMVTGNRKIGLGIMGFADMLILLGMKYNSSEALGVGEKIMGFINDTSKDESRKLAEEKGEFPNWEHSVYGPGEENLRLRNATRTTIAPTGSICMIAWCSSGIEPIFSPVTISKRADKEFFEVDYAFYKLGREQGWLTEGNQREILKKIVSNKGNLESITEIPEQVRNLFVTAHDIDPKFHVEMQAAFQRQTDNAVSKTINLPNSATKEDIMDVYMSAWKLGCKGITVYRDGSREEQVLYRGGETSRLEDITAHDSEEIERPEVTFGMMVKAPIGLDEKGKKIATYDFIGLDEAARTVEFFLNTGKSGQSITASNEALGRSVSKLFQMGLEPERVADMYRGIKGGSPGYHNDIIIQSSPDSVSYVIDRFLRGDFVEGMTKAAQAYALRVEKRQEQQEEIRKIGRERAGISNENTHSNPAEAKQEEAEQRKEKPKILREPCSGCGATEYEIINRDGCLFTSCCGFSLKGCHDA